MSNYLQKVSNAFADIGTQVTQSLVRLQIGRQGTGTGIIWRSNGLIVTNAHVVGQAEKSLTVILPDGRKLPARRLAVDPTDDLAALQIAANGLLAIVPGDSRQLKPGDFVLALGFPWGIARGATAGIVIGTNAALPEVKTPTKEWIAASLHLRPGHSGGPMVDAQGRLVGINTMMNGPDIGVAIPLHVVQAFLQRA